MDPLAVIKAHVPSLSDADEAMILRSVARLGFDENADVADLAQRTCSCGLSISGFYAYADHLSALMGGQAFLL